MAGFRREGHIWLQYSFEKLVCVFMHAQNNQYSIGDVLTCTLQIDDVCIL